MGWESISLCLGIAGWAIVGWWGSKPAQLGVWGGACLSKGPVPPQPPVPPPPPTYNKQVGVRVVGVVG